MLHLQLLIIQTLVLSVVRLWVPPLMPPPLAIHGVEIFHWVSCGALGKVLL